MLTNLIGISELVELLHDANGKATESNLEGPMYVPDAPERNMGDRLGIDRDGEPLIVSGYVLDLDGKPVADAIVDVWQPNSQGLYDLQDPSQPKDNFRARFRPKADGMYTFETVVPTGYHIPASGPCGEILELLGRHTWRAAHIHVKLSAPGYTPLTTQIFIAGDPHIDSDTTFSVKTAIASLQKHDAVDELMASGQHAPFYTTNFNFVLRSSERK